MEFQPFDKIARLNREIVITEKIDGTNAQIFIQDRKEVDPAVLDDLSESFFSVTHEGTDYVMWAGSRNRWLDAKQDNFGFARWAGENREDLIKLGPGRHFGEWWGQGIQRGYGLQEKRFSLFNVARWYDYDTNTKLCPSCCDVVPILYRGGFQQQEIDRLLKSLSEIGSSAAPGFMDPEGVVIYHTAARQLFKVTIKNDEVPKGAVIA